MNETEIALAFKELGHTARLGIFQYLVRAGRKGAPVGEIQASLGIPNSTLSHHIAALVKAGLLTQERSGRTLYCIPNYERIEFLSQYLVDECCVNEAECDDG